MSEPVTSSRADAPAAPADPARPAAREPLPWWRALLFRLAAVLLALVPFAVAEAAFVALGWGRPAAGDDPFVGFRAVHPLFVPSADGRRCEISPARQRFFQPQSFAARKAANGYRIFCLGGSTVQGRPFAVETSFTTYLELNLRVADPGREWEVVNCGGISYASYRLVPILEEVLAYEPDLIVLYTGHNEFLEDREYGHIRRLPGYLTGPCELAMRTRTFHLLRRAYLRLTGDAGRGASRRPVLAPEADALLDYKDGLKKYHRDDAWREAVIEHFRFNLARMVEVCRRAGVDLLLVNPVSNLRDCPPFKSQHREGLSPQGRRRWEALCGQAGEHLGTETPRAVKLLERAAAIDDQHAGLHYFLGKCYDAAGHAERARGAYLRAKELDVCPLRMLEPMHEALLETARRTRTPLVDARQLIAARSRNGIPGGYLMVDHVHPSIAGHRLIADALTDELIRRRAVHPRAGWKYRCDRQARKHLESLGGFYFAKGRQRLRSLRRWADGRAILVRPKPEPNAPASVPAGGPGRAGKR